MNIAKSVPQARPVTPLGILCDHLKAAVLAQAQHDTADLNEHLQAALRLAVGLDPYVEACTTRESEGLIAIARATQAEHWQDRFSDGETVRQLEQEMLSGHVEGQLLKMFVHMTRAHRVLDIGMFTGYSALAMAEALPENGLLVACEVDPYVAEFAEKHFQAIPHGDKIEIRLGPALKTLEQLSDADSSFDLIFIDADKREYLQYFQMILESGLLAVGGFICVDNTLLQGQPYLEQQSANGAAIAEFNRAIADDPRVEQVLIPVRDGLTVIRQLPH